MRYILNNFCLICLLLFLTLSVFQGCTSGGDDDSSSGNGLATNACGDLGLGTRIVNGANCANPGSSPIVRLAFLSGTNQVGFCSGSMITSRDVLTAAHCFIKAPERVVAIVGDDLESSRQFEARTWSIHPNPEVVGDKLVSNDVAVVHLIEDTGLPTLPMMISQSVSSGEVISIFGYGTDENGDFDAEDLESGQMLVSGVSETHISASFNGNGSNTCQGDSGGPALSSRLGYIAIAGLTSTGTQVDCLSGDTTNFTNLSSTSVADFLRRVVPAAAFR